MKHDWDLIERLLHEAQNSAGKPFAPRRYAEDLAAEQENAGQPVDNLDHLRAEAPATKRACWRTASSSRARRKKAATARTSSSPRAAHNC